MNWHTDHTTPGWQRPTPLTAAEQVVARLDTYTQEQHEEKILEARARRATRTVHLHYGYGGCAARGGITDFTLFKTVNCPICVGALASWHVVGYMDERGVTRGNSR